jgi:CcmD family protein
MWLIVVFYVFMLANRQRNVREELKLLHQLLKEDEEADNK